MSNDFNFLHQLPDADVSALRETGKNRARREVGEVSLDLTDENPVMDGSTVFKPLIPNDASFDPRMAFEIALNFEPYYDIYPRYDLTEDEWLSIAAHPLFKKSVLGYQKEVQEDGLQFRIKARIQAEAYLKDVHLLVKNASTPASVKADMIKWITKVADLEPAQSGGQQGAIFNLQINM